MPCNNPALSYTSEAAGIGSTAVLVSAVAREVVGVHVTNINTVDVFLQIFDDDAAADVTVGTTVPKQSFGVPAGDGTNRGMFDRDFGENPIQLKNGLVIAVTTTHYGNGNPTTAPIVNILYH